MQKNRERILFIAYGAIIAAIYVATTVPNPISSGPIQIRFSEALCVLPLFTPAAIPGLFIGCLIANFVEGLPIYDVIFGSLATLAAAMWAYSFTKMKFTASYAKWLTPWPAIIFNAAIIPFVLRYAYGLPYGIPLLVVTVGAGQIISCAVLGYPLLLLLEKYRKPIFGITKT